MKKKIGYVCGTTWAHHMGQDNDPGPSGVYPTLAAIKELTCVAECGMVKIEMTAVKEYPPTKRKL